MERDRQDIFTQSLQGDHHAMALCVIQSLALHLLTILTVGKLTAEVQDTTNELAMAALAFVQEERK